MKTKLNISYMAKIGILSAFAFIIMLFDIPLWFAPSFYKIDLSEVIVLIGGFSMGPLAALFIELIKVLLNLMIHGSDTASIGEISNFIIGLSLVLPASFIYQRKKSVSGAIIGMIVGTITFTVLGAFINLYVLLPVYAKVFDIPLEALVEMGSKINPSINSVNTLVLFATVPFNLVKGVISSIVTMLLYKRLSPILHK